MKTTVYVAGVCGRMGQAVVRAVSGEADLQIVGAADLADRGKSLHAALGIGPENVFIEELDERALKESSADVMVDFTGPAAVLANARTALRAGVVPVIGATGLSESDLASLRDLSGERGTGVFIAPNFALGVILLMRFAKEAAAYFPDVEIIEMHHDRKLDAPSGTALRTAALIAETREAKQQGHPAEEERLPHVRGGEVGGMRIHSVRLPGLEAHQEVILGGLGQALTLRHDTYTREAYMPGVLLAVRKSRGLKDFVVGLENYLW